MKEFTEFKNLCVSSRSENELTCAAKIDTKQIAEISLHDYSSSVDENGNKKDKN